MSMDENQTSSITMQVNAMHGVFVYDYVSNKYV